MVVRKYEESDERDWLRCRVISFLDCSYYNDVFTKRELYENDSICLVAEDDGKIIGLLDVEIETKAGDLCVAGKQEGLLSGIWRCCRNTGEIMWRILCGIRQRNSFCKRKSNTVKYGLRKIRLQTAGIWHRDFGILKEKNWLRCYARPSEADWFLNRENVGKYMVLKR